MEEVTYQLQDKADSRMTVLEAVVNVLLDLITTHFPGPNSRIMVVSMG
jgi:hypothetical protein